MGSVIGDGSIASAISADGKVIVGRDGAAQATRWVGSGIPTSLGSTGLAKAVNSDGSAIVGDTGSEAFLWTAAAGLKTINSLLTGQGVSLEGWTLSTATGISGNGKVIVGYGNHNGATEGWFVRFP